MPRSLKAFLLYRTYHGSAMSAAVASASLAAWSEEAHVRENRALYAAKFAQLQPKLAAALPCSMPEAAFYLWARTPIDDADFAKRLLAEQAVATLPGSFLAREARRRESRRRATSGSPSSPASTSAPRPSTASYRSCARCDEPARLPSGALSPPAPLRREAARREPSGH